MGRFWSGLLCLAASGNVIRPVVGFLACPQSSTSGTVLAALTERQLQFWEDVGDGLDDIESFYAKKGQDIDRIREFGKR